MNGSHQRRAREGPAAFQGTVASPVTEITSRFPMKYYVYKLVPPRPTFGTDMRDDERELMRRHVEYWRGIMRRGWVVLFGPVIDPAGPYGLGVVRLPDGGDPVAIVSEDPCMRANCGFRSHLAPMAQAEVAPSATTGPSSPPDPDEGGTGDEQVRRNAGQQ